MANCNRNTANAKRGRILKDPLPPTHMMRVNDDLMWPAYQRGYWMGVRPGNRPLAKREWVFTNRRDGSEVIGLVVSCSPTGWRIQQWNPLRYRHLSRSHWRATWRVRYVEHCRDAGDSWHKARALGDYERAEAIRLAEYGKGPMPPPLPVDLVTPTIYELRGSL